MTIFILTLLLKILFFWMLISIVAFAIAWLWIAVAKREPANHIPPLPEGSILGKSNQRDMLSQ